MLSELKTHFSISKPRDGRRFFIELSGFDNGVMSSSGKSYNDLAVSYTHICLHVDELAENRGSAALFKSS